MRTFSTFEKDILKYMVTNKEFVTMQLIYNFCGATIIEWDKEHTEIRLYGNKGEEDTTRDNLFDIVSLLSYLDKEGYVFITPSKINSDRLIYK